MVFNRPIHGLAGLLLVFLFLANPRWSPDNFGAFHDDSIYLSSARALAEGRGAVLPSVPGDPAQTKYPPLYPWMLSLIWRVWPVFPDNLIAGFWASALAGCVFLAGCFFLFRQLGLADPACLGLTAVCAAHPLTLVLSTSLLSDMPFMALGIWACVGAWAVLAKDDETSGNSGRWWFVVAAIGLAVATRSVGIGVAFGIGAFALLRGRTWRGPAAAGCGLAVLGMIAIWSGQRAWVPDSPGVGSGFSQTMLYYTQLSGIYRLMGIYLTQVLGNSPYMLWSSVARVAVPPTSDL